MKRVMFDPVTGKTKECDIAFATYSNVSVCPCGFTALKETVRLGRKYRVVLDSINTMIFGCGGCGKTHRVPAILAQEHQRPGYYFYLPVGIFNPRSEWTR